MSVPCEQNPLVRFGQLENDILIAGNFLVCGNPFLTEGEEHDGQFSYLPYSLIPIKSTPAWVPR